eukprot:543248-Rhodomonas_salina.1
MLRARGADFGDGGCRSKEEAVEEIGGEEEHIRQLCDLSAPLTPSRKDEKLKGIWHTQKWEFGT